MQHHLQRTGAGDWCSVVQHANCITVETPVAFSQTRKSAVKVGLLFSVVIVFVVVVVSIVPAVRVDSLITSDTSVYNLIFLCFSSLNEVPAFSHDWNDQSHNSQPQPISCSIREWSPGGAPEHQATQIIDQDQTSSCLHKQRNTLTHSHRLMND